jgi:2-methylisocitrate lyase-like PEP mutase family enzyme
VLFVPDSDAIYTAGTYRSNIYEPDGANPIAMEFVDTAREFRRIQDAYRIPSSVPILKQIGDQLRLSALGSRLEELARQMEASVCETPGA